MLTPGAAAVTAQVADLVLSPEEVRALVKDLQDLQSELEAEQLRLATLEPGAWGQEFESTTRLNAAYANAQQRQHELAESLSGHAGDLAGKLRAAADDLEREDHDVARSMRLLMAALESGSPQGNGAGEGGR